MNIVLGKALVIKSYRVEGRQGAQVMSCRESREVGGIQRFIMNQSRDQSSVRGDRCEQSTKTGEFVIKESRLEGDDARPQEIKIM